MHLVARRRRAQIMPLFVFIVMFMLGIAGLMIDTAGLILVRQDFDALGWRTAHFAATRLAIGCTPTTDQVPGSPCAIRDATIFGQASGEVSAYAGTWTTVGPDRTGIPITLDSVALSMPTDTSATVRLTGCYKTFLIGDALRLFGVSRVGACAGGDVALETVASAVVRLSN